MTSPSPSHSHSHSHSPAHRFPSSAASTYSSAQWQKDLLSQTQAFVLSHINWIGVDFLHPATASEKDVLSTRQIRVLDYACGLGTITNILQGYATEFVGVDLSENMVKAYNENFAALAEQRETTMRAEAVVGDLLDSSGPSPSVSGPEFFDFDLAVVGYGFHHFEDLDVATSRLASRLRPGGVLLIVDFVTHAKEEGTPGKNTVAHYGFEEEEVRVIFEAAELIDVGMVEMEDKVELKRPGTGDGAPGFQRKVFLARGRKPL